MKNLTLLFIICSVNLLNSQNYKFGKVSEEELREKKHAVDPEAHAAVLYKSQNIKYIYLKDDGFVQVNEIHERIKIYDKEGFEWATKEVKLFDRSKSQSEELTNLKGYTYNLIGNKVEKTKLRNESVFDEKNNKFWATKKLVMPDVKEGSVIEFEYTIESPYTQIDDVILQYEIPINQLDVNIKIPEYFYFNRIVNPKSSYYPQLNDSKISRTEVLYTTHRNGSNYGKINNTTTETSNWEFKENRTEINESNIPALKDEPLIGNLDNYRCKLIWEYTMFKGPNNRVENFATTWEKVTESIYKSESFGGQLDKNNYYEDDLDVLLQDINDPITKTSLIYNFVKSKVKWNGYFGYSTDDGVKNAYKEGVGNIAEINLMLVSMLKYANLDANPIIISTRNNGIPILPNLSGFNYVVAAIETPNGKIILDATNPFLTPNILPVHAINWYGRIIKEDGSSSSIDLNTHMDSKETVFMFMKINDDLSVNGKVRNQLTNQLAFDFRNDYSKMENEQHISFLEKGNGNIVISNLEIKNKLEIYKPVTYDYEFHSQDAVEEIGDKLYFSPKLFLGLKENAFKSEVRHYPIDFIYSISDKYVINIELPQGYVVESLPENSKIEFNGKDSVFSYLSKDNGAMIQFTIALDINKTLILPNQYEQFKNFFQMVIDKQTEKIVLKKV